MKPKVPPAELLIPALALAFAVYFFSSIAGLAWEASANGMLIGGILVVLVVAQLIRLILKPVERAALWGGGALLGQRLGLLGVTVAFIATLPWLGLTLGLLLALLASLWIMGVRNRIALVLVPLAVAAAAFALFIVLLQSDFPHGPVELLLS